MNSIDFKSEASADISQLILALVFIIILFLLTQWVKNKKQKKNIKDFKTLQIQHLDKYRRVLEIEYKGVSYLILETENGVVQLKKEEPVNHD